MRTPNPRDEVRFLADLPRGCAEGRAPALQAGSPGAVPGDSTNLAVVAPRWSNRSVRDRARFDSVRRLRVDVARRRLSSTNDGERVCPPTRGLFKANDCASNAASPVRFRDSAPTQVWLEGRASVCQSDGAGSIPATCSNGALLREQHDLQNRGARFNSAARLECFRPSRCGTPGGVRPGPASSKRRAARSTRAGSAGAPPAAAGLRASGPPSLRALVLASLARFARVAFV
jgi:hypothetical protein